MVDWCAEHVVSELLMWDLDGELHRSVFHEGSGLRDALGVLEFDWQHLAHICCVATLVAGGTSLVCRLSEERFGTRTAINGALYLGEFLSTTPGPVPSKRLRDLSLLAADMAVGIGASYLGLASEDDRAAALDKTVLLQSPCVFLATVDGKMPSMGLRGAHVTGQVTVEWLQDPDSIRGRLETDSAVIRRARAHLRRNLGI